MVPTSDDTSLFLISYNSETNELIFRSSRNPQYRQSETVMISDNMAYINLHYFHVEYLKNITL